MSGTDEGEDAKPAAMPVTVEDVVGEHKGRGGGVFRAAVFGANDGLVSNTGLVMGVAGAAAAPEYVLISGVAGLLAGAFSMAAGEYVSMRAQRDLFEHRIAKERAEIAANPEVEVEELAVIYADRGVPLREARHVARYVIANPDKALEAMAREELGLNPDDLGSPLGAAGYSFLSFAAGATVPLLPFVAGFGSGAVPVSAGLAGVSLFAVGGAIARFSGRGFAAGGLRMLAIGAAAGAATYAIGGVLGVAVG